MTGWRWLTILAMMPAASFCKGPQTPPPSAPEPQVSDPAQPSGPKAPVNMLENSNFDGGVSAPWMPVVLDPAKAEAEIRDGAFCVDITDRGKNNWDIQLSYRGLTIEKGHRYQVRAKVWANKDTAVRGKVGMSGPPYREYWHQEMAVGPAPQVMTGGFAMSAKSDPTAEIAFHAGGSLARLNNLPLTVCIDEVTLTDPEYVPPEKAAELPRADILVNQIGYLPALRKTATVRLGDTAPAPWVLTRDGKQIASGKTTVFGADIASGDTVHLIDFSEVTEAGEGYRLEVGALESHPFVISNAVYSALKIDAQRYFYHHRSGVPIEMPYAGDSVWAHPAGHPQDSGVPCLAGIGCDYRLDVSGGWYDAGDHGKYVVNGGYTVWALLNAYERAVHVLKKPGAFPDGALNIPESGNGISDLLDEVRFELEFLMRMEVPKGEPLAGMVHHKIHDESWSPLPTAPYQSSIRRFLHAPSTAATLNLSAVAAQAARIWKDIDPEFSKKCLETAKRTFAAAKKHPEMFAPPEDNQGGGPYEDAHVDDEFFWAAAELFVTTGEGRYLKQITKSKYYAKVPTVDDIRGTGWMERTAASWQYVSVLGMLSLLTAPNDLAAKDRARLIEKLSEAADVTARVIAREGYRTALTGKPRPDYYWGSNFAAMNNLMVSAAAYDFTGKPEYRDALVEGADYLFGRNPLDQCYVTGYGARPVMNPHHRYFARSADPAFPPPPPGFLAGGPNQHRQDPRIQASVPKDAPAARVYSDHIDSYSTNEVAINWNAALVWVTAALDEVAAASAGH